MLAADLKTGVDIYALYQVIEINAFIIGAKLGGRSKGFIKDGKPFHNSISLDIFEDTRYLNVKVFVNGKLLISGAREDLGTERKVISQLVQYLNLLEGEYSCTFALEDGLMVGIGTDYLYGVSETSGYYKRVGMAQDEFVKDPITKKNTKTKRRVYKVGKETIRMVDGLYLLSTESCNKFSILNKVCREVGTQHGVKGISDMTTTDTLELLYDAKDKVIGYRNYHGDLNEPYPSTTSIKVLYSVVATKVYAGNIEMVVGNMNSNFKVNMGGTSNEPAHYIDITALQNAFELYGILSIETSDKFYGSKIKLYYNKYQHGICRCQRGNGCNCAGITLVVYPSGKCTIMGAKSTKQVQWGWRLFKRILKEHHQFFYKPLVDLEQLQREFASDTEVSFKEFLPPQYR